jgi:hypothetical protein
LLLTMTSLVLLAYEPSDHASKGFWESTTKQDRWAKDKAKGHKGFKQEKAIT